MASAWASDHGISLDPSADVPLAVQLDWGLRAAIESGRLLPGDRLPGLRDLGEELGVNPKTVRAAVARLEAKGVLESRHGSGTFVARDARVADDRAPLVARAVQWAGEAGVTPRELAAALYVADPGAGRDDPEAAERRSLRDEIAVLDRLVGTFEARLPYRVEPEPAEREVRAGSRLLGVAELREQRDALVRRLAAVQDALDREHEDDDLGDDDLAAEGDEAAARSGAAPVLRRRPGISPA